MKRIIILVLAVLVSGGVEMAYSQDRKYNKTPVHRGLTDQYNALIKQGYDQQEALRIIKSQMGHSMNAAAAQQGVDTVKYNANESMNNMVYKGFPEMMDKLEDLQKTREYLDANIDKLTPKEKFAILMDVTDPSWGDDLTAALDIESYNPKDRNQVDILQKASEKEYARQKAELDREESKVSKYKDSVKPNLEQLRGKLYEVMSSDRKYPWRGSDAEFFGDANRAVNDIRTARGNGANVDEETAQAYMKAFDEAREAYNGAADGAAKARMLREKLDLFKEGVNSLGACLDCNAKK